MACFIVPAVEAVITTVASKVIKEDKKEVEAVVESSHGEDVSAPVRTPFKKKLKWLSAMLWGGSILLAFEHIWHGEVTPWFPFLTNAASPESAAEMLQEMATTGVLMAVFVTGIWGVMVAVSNRLEKRAIEEAQSGEEA